MWTFLASDFIERHVWVLGNLSFDGGHGQAMLYELFIGKNVVVFGDVEIGIYSVPNVS